jgi:ADP-ribosyl-[dinitrogen reductase] hydrolase
VLDGSASAWGDAVDALREICRDAPDALAELDLVVAYPGATGSGYVVDCLHSARRSVAAGSYEVAVSAAVRLGNDTDTTAAVAGGIAGVRDGVDAIPNRWRSALRGQALVAPMLDALLASRRRPRASSRTLHVTSR